MAADIAVVSFERFLNGDDQARREVAREIYDAFSTVGWVYIKDHGVDTVEDAFSLVRRLDRSLVRSRPLIDIKAKQFFEQPFDKKAKYRLVDAEVNQGYTADGDVRSSSLTQPRRKDTNTIVTGR
jgi:isopenicillin N synthase-like dioxygenase